MQNPAKPVVPVHELISQRWSPRAFDATTVSNEDVASLLEAARWAASCFNEQPWRFIVAPRSEEKLFETVLSTLAEPNQLWAKNAGLLLLGIAKSTFTRGDKPNRHASHDLGQATAQLCLQGASMGLFAHQMAGFDVDKARAEFGVPEGFDLVTAIAVGRYGSLDALPEPLQEKEQAERVRMKTSEWAFGAQWGKGYQ